MSETFFPVNDLVRRKFETSITIISLTSCVASTLFLILFSDKVGFGISLMIKEKFTSGFSVAFSRFLLFISFLFFASGVIFASFMAFIMISQRVKNIGLMKAAGCPNDLIFGYFFNELLIVTLISCFMGVVLGLLADFASANGDVIYVALKDLQNIVGVLKPNILMVKVNPSVSYANIIDEIRTAIKSLNSEFEILELNTILDKNLAFLSYIWSTIMFLPLFSLASASLCFMGYIVLVLTEQRQEFGVLRALGAEPRTIIKIVAIESLVVLLSSYACGVVFGRIITLLILVPNPAVTNLTILQIAGLLLTALVAMFTISLHPAVKFARKSILEMMG